MKEKKEVRNVGIGFVEALTLLFIALKLLGQIGWSWFWVLSPIWISVLGFAAILLAVVIIGSITSRL